MNEEDIEDGEIPSSPDAMPNEPYRPLQRPINVQHKYQSQKEAEVDENIGHSDEEDDEGEDSDSDSDLNNSMAKRMKSTNGKMEVAKDTGGGDVFKKLAANFQASIRKTQRNNVWGSFLQEDSLNTEMTGIGVSRTLKDLQSDRGAETYDYFAATASEPARTGSQRNSTDSSSVDKEAVDELNAEMDDYWNTKNNDNHRRTEAIQAGKKRSIKDRLGERQSKASAKEDSNDAFETMSIPPPGVPRQIPDLNPTVLESLHENMDEEDSSADGGESENKAEILGDELASKLSEPKMELMVGVVDLVGHEVAIELFNKTKDIEAKGGMMIKNGERRRTPGGVFLQLLRDMGSDESEPRVNNKQVKLFFAQSNRDFQHRGRGGAKKKRGGGDFKSELEAFKKFSKKAAAASAKSKAKKDSEELKPLPDILSCVAQRMSEEKSGSDTEPPLTEAPPNSVERTVNSYDDDFLNTECETEDIELF